MFIALFDKDFKSIGSRKTYPASKWSLTRRAFDMDGFTATCPQIERSARAVFVGLFEPKGRLKYLAFSGRPKDQGGLTSVIATDLRRVFMQKLVIRYDNFRTNHVVSSWVSYLMNLPRTYHGSKLGLTYSVDVSEIAADEPAWKSDSIPEEKDVGSVWEELQAAMSRYGFTIEAEANITTDPSTHEQTGAIVFKCKTLGTTHPIKLSDFDAPRVMDDSTETNCCNATDGTNGHAFYILTEIATGDDVILEGYAATMAINAGTHVLRAPLKSETFVEEDLEKATAKAMAVLEKNRYKGKVEIQVNSTRGLGLQNATLHDRGLIYGYNSADDTTKKLLPVSSIKEDSSGSLTVCFGRLDDYYYA